MRIEQKILMIEWHKFKPGTSFFIPCIDRAKVQRYITRQVRRMKIDNVVSKQVIERGIYGLRVWRGDPILPPHSC